MTINQMDQLTSILIAAQKVRAIAQLIGNYNEVDHPIDVTIWPQIGDTLDELAANIESACKQINSHQPTRIKINNNKKSNRRTSHV